MSSPIGMRAAIVALAVVAALASQTSAHAVPQPPHIFFGSVTVGGSQASPGLKIEARILNVNYANSEQAGQNTRVGAGGSYGSTENFHVCADDDSSAPKEGGVDDETIEFYIEEIRAEARDTGGSLIDPVLYQKAEATQLNLSIGSLSDPKVVATPSASQCGVGSSSPASVPVLGVVGLLVLAASIQTSAGMIMRRRQQN